MRRNPYYRLEYFANVPYLTCFGQANADFKHDYRLDETGAFLWEHLEETSDIKALTDCCAAHFQRPAEQYAGLEANITTFVNFLYRVGVLLPENHTPQTFPHQMVLKIAGLYCRIYSPLDAFPDEFLHFEHTGSIPADAEIQHIYIQPGSPAHTENGPLLLRNAELSVISAADKYLLLFPAFRYIKEAHMSKNGQSVTVYCTLNSLTEALQEISYTIRLTFLYFAQLHGMLMIHSASILYRDKIWLFSGPSGTGKSTHTSLWQQLCQTPVINGDLNLVSPEHDAPVIYGTPWCGTSGICDTRTYPLGGIILLKQDHENKVIPLADDEKQLRVLHRTPSPSWIETMQKQNCCIIRDFYDKILICQLNCTPDERAVTCIKSHIDFYLDRK